MLATERFRGVACSVQPAMELLTLMGFPTPWEVSVNSQGRSAVGVENASVAIGVPGSVWVNLAFSSVLSIAWSPFNPSVVGASMS